MTKGGIRHDLNLAKTDIYDVIPVYFTFPAKSWFNELKS